MKLLLDLNDVNDYATFLRVKSLPRYSFAGRVAVVPDEYAALLGVSPPAARDAAYEPLPALFDYQAAVAALAIRKRKFAAYVDCGLGKALIALEFARHAAAVNPGRGVLIVCPLMVVGQTVREAARFYGDDLPVRRLPAAELPAWLAEGVGVAVTNFEAIRDGLEPGNLAALIIDEASVMKSHYGKWGTRLIALGRGLAWKLCLTGTPAPNDRIEYATHAVFLDREPNVNAFLARYFVNRGETANRWELKAHALRPFYRSLSDWCIFLSDPATYGWKDNAGGPPPINVTVHEIDLTAAQRDISQAHTGQLFVNGVGGIGARSKLAQLAKGRHAGADVATNKPAFIRSLVGSFAPRSTIVWCLYNAEQDGVAALFPGCANVDGSTPDGDREPLVEDFKAGRRKVLVSKPKVLGFGLNLQVCTRMVFSGLQDSFESYYQAVKRANRYGSTEPLEVHIPVTEIEAPMIETVMRKAHRVAQDTKEQEAIFREVNATL